jgi:two-component system nitrogen regulation response regulator GlnG
MTKKIFIIDDDQDVREIMQYALQSEGYRVEVFENAHIALDILTDLPPRDLPSLLIVDYMMPVMDGITFINKINEEYPLTIGTIPVAFTSAMGELSESVTLPRGVVTLQKPMDLDELIALVTASTSGHL